MSKARRHIRRSILAVMMTLSSAGAQAPHANQATEAEDSTQKAPASRPAGQFIEGSVLNALGGGIAGATVRIEALEAGLNDPPLAEGTTNKLGDLYIILGNHRWRDKL